MKRVISIEEADRGNIVRCEEDYSDGTSAGSTEIIEGQQGSVNLRDRTRRRCQELLSDWFPSALKAERANNNKP